MNKTKHSKLFDSSWGRFIDGSLEPQIFENRIQFIEEFNIKRKKKLLNSYRHIFYYSLHNWYSGFDHTRVYYTEDDKTILITNPYAQDRREWFEERGYSVYKPLYNSSAVTYIKVVDKDEVAFFNQKVKDKRKELKRKMKNINQMREERKKIVDELSLLLGKNYGQNEYVLIN